jgi:hypothetical protein
VRARPRPAPRRTALGAARIGLAVVALAPRAQALELEFSKSPICPIDDIPFRVEQAIAQPLASLAGPTFRVSIERVAAGYVGRVDVPRTDGDAVDSSARRVTASSCDELVDTVTLTLVLAIAGQRDKGARSTEARASLLAEDSFGRDAAATNPAPARGTEPDAAAARSAESPGAGAQVAAFGSMVGDAGSLPAFGLGVAAGADVAWPSVELRALGMVLPGAEGSVEPGNPAAPGAEIGLLAGGLLVCAPLSTRLVGAQLAACVGAELGRLSGHGTRIDTSHSSTRWWSAPRADLAWRWALPLRWLALELGATVAAPIWRDEFVLESVGSVHRAAPVIGRASLSLRAIIGH